MKLAAKRAEDDAPAAPEWVKHQPHWSAGVGVFFGDEHALVRCSCGALPPADNYGPAWFADHLRTLGAPEYMQTYFRDWACHVEAPTGLLDRDAVARELSDYDVVMTQASGVFAELTGGRISKPNTAAGYVIDYAEQRYAATYAEMLCGRASRHGGSVRRVLRELAEEWHPGSVDEWDRKEREAAKLRRQNRRLRPVE